MDDELVSVQLPYGAGRVFRADLLRKRLLAHHRPPAAVESVDAAVRAALDQPIDFPEIARAFVPGDRVTVVIDEGTPQPDLLFALLWEHLQRAGVMAGDITILRPAGWLPLSGSDPRSRLPAGDKEAVVLKRHDPMQESGCHYLASTAAGERVYLAAEATDCDAVVTIGPAQFDPVLGVRGGASVLFPGLSNAEAIRKAQGLGHDELGPDDLRPMRQRVDEVGWLLGLQVSICVIPSGGSGIHSVLAGQTDSVLRQAREQLKARWEFLLPERAEVVLVTVPEDASGHGWEQVAAAIDAGRRSVERNGRIVVLSQLKAEPGPGLEILRQSRTPRDALKPVQKANVPDVLAASRIAAALDWANVSLLSRLDPNLVEDLFLLPVDSEDEVRRLLQNDDMIAIIESAQQTSVLSGV